MKSYLFPVLALLFFISCRENSGERVYLDAVETMDTETSAEASFMKSMPSSPQPPPTSKIEMTKKVVKSGRIEFRSEDIEKDYEDLVSTLNKYNAFIENSNQSKTDYRITYSLTIRVPVEKFDTLHEEIADLSDRIVSKSSNIEDVTERYYDLQTRIKNKKALELRYLDILEKANNVKDILEVEAKLNNVRTEIERLEGQFRYLSKRVSLSTIHVTIFEVLPYAQEYIQRPGFGNRLMNALGSGWEGFLSFIVWSIGLWPFIALLIGIIFLIRRIRRKRRLKKD